MATWCTRRSARSLPIGGVEADEASRGWYRIDDYRLTPDGHCPDSHASLPGRFERFTQAFGNRRIPIAIGQ